MANAKDIAATNPETSILVVGDSGTHKTYFLGTIPGILIYDFDGGMAINRGKDVEYESFRDAPFGSKVHNRARGIYPWGDAWPAFINHVNKIGAEFDKGEKPALALGVDSLTTLSNICMNYVMKSSGRKPSDGIRIQDWGDQSKLVEVVVDQLTAWPVPLVATAHVQRDTNQMMETIEMLPLLTGKLAAKIGLYFDEVYYTKITGKKDEKKFVFQTESSGMVKQAKTRYGVPDGTEMEWDAIAKYLVQGG